MIYYEDRRVLIRDAEEADVGRMADRMREIEKAEVWASHRFTPQEALTVSYQGSTKRLSITLDGEVVAMFGIVPDSLLDKNACVWLLTTESVNRMWVRFLKVSRAMVSLLRAQYTLYNWVDCRYEKSIKWVQWCGGKLSDAAPFGPDGLPFRFFSFEGGR